MPENPIAVVTLIDNPGRMSFTEITISRSGPGQEVCIFDPMRRLPSIPKSIV
jgi:hypothetical protein